jgi:hypothetical protein
VSEKTADSPGAHVVRVTSLRQKGGAIDLFRAIEDGREVNVAIHPPIADQLIVALGRGDEPIVQVEDWQVLS